MPYHRVNSYSFAFPLLNTDINKFLWMVRIGGSTDRGAHIKEMDYYAPSGDFRIDKEGSPVLLNCLMYKMCYYRFGQVYTEGGKAPGYDRVRGASLTTIVTYLLTKEIHSSGAGLVAGAMISIVPGYISRSVAGSYDNEGIAIFCMLLTYYTWIKAVKTGAILWATLAALAYWKLIPSVSWN